MLASALRRLSLSAAAAAGSRSLLAQQLEGELAAEARAALLRQHAFIGAVGYFNRHAIQRAQPQPRSMTPVGDARTQSQPQPSAFSGGYDQRSVDDDDDDDEVDEDDDEDDGDAADAGAPQLRFVVCLLGNDLDAVTPAEIADIVVSGEAAESEVEAQEALASALAQCGALSVRRGTVDALHLSGWRFGHFADGDAFTLFDLGGPVVYRTQLEGGVPCLQWRGSEHAPLPLSDIRAVRIRFPDAATGDLTRRQLLAVDAQGQLHTLLEDSVPPVTVDANQEAALHVHSPEQRLQLEVLVTTEFMLLAAAQLARFIVQYGGNAQLQLPKLLHADHNPYARQRLLRWQESLRASQAAADAL